MGPRYGHEGPMAWPLIEWIAKKQLPCVVERDCFGKRVALGSIAVVSQPEI